MDKNVYSDCLNLHSWLVFLMKWLSLKKVTKENKIDEEPNAIYFILEG